MTAPLTVAWSLSLLMEASLILRLWHRFRQMYTGFLLYLVGDLVAGLMLMLVAFAMPGYVYTAAWVVLELGLAVCQFFVSIEALRRIWQIRHYLPELIFGAAAIASVLTGVLYWQLRSPVVWSSWLEPAATAKATIELFLCLLVAGLLAASLANLPRRMALSTVEFRHGLMLVGYMASNSMSYFLVARGMSIGRPVQPVPLMLLSAICFGTWTLLFRGQRVVE